MIQGMMVISLSHIVNGHGFLIRDHIRDYTRLQEGPLCPLVPQSFAANIESCSGASLIFSQPLLGPSPGDQVSKSLICKYTLTLPGNPVAHPWGDNTSLFGLADLHRNPGSLNSGPWDTYQMTYISAIRLPLPITIATMRHSSHNSPLITTLEGQLLQGQRPNLETRNKLQQSSSPNEL